MNYTNPALINALSAQYVLGTLRGKARMRFESLKFSNSSIQEAVNHWESQLHPLSFELQPVHPQDHVWQNILLRISGHKAIQSSQQAPPAASNITPITRAPSQTKWKWLTGLATAACLVLAILLVPYKTAPMDALQSVAVMTNEANKTLWSFDITQQNIRVKTTAFVPKLADNDYQLWIVPASGDAPISIGLMLQSKEFTLRKPDIFDNIKIAALAVSKEPKGGSPNGSPTEVLYTTEIAQL